MSRKAVRKGPKFLNISPNLTIIINKLFKKFSENLDMNATKFIVKLLEMMKEFPNIINWSTEGREIQILDLERFSVEVHPKYFNNPNYHSFLRQLNMYGFKKISKRKNSVSFSHPQFRHGNQQHFKSIKRRPKNKMQKAFKKSQKRVSTHGQENIAGPSSSSSLLDHQEIRETICMIKKQTSDKGVLLMQKLQRMLLKGAATMCSISSSKLSENSSTQHQKQNELINHRGDVYGFQFGFEHHISNNALYFQD